MRIIYLNTGMYDETTVSTILSSNNTTTTLPSTVVNFGLTVDNPIDVDNNITDGYPSEYLDEFQQLIQIRVDTEAFGIGDIDNDDITISEDGFLDGDALNPIDLTIDTEDDTEDDDEEEIDEELNTDDLQPIEVTINEYENLDIYYELEYCMYMNQPRPVEPDGTGNVKFYNDEHNILPPHLANDRHLARNIYFKVDQRIGQQEKYISPFIKNDTRILVNAETFYVGMVPVNRRFLGIRHGLLDTPYYHDNGLIGYHPRHLFDFKWNHTMRMLTFAEAWSVTHNFGNTIELALSDWYGISDQNIFYNFLFSLKDVIDTYKLTTSNALWSYYADAA